MPPSSPSKGQTASYAERAKRASFSSAPMPQSIRSLSSTTSNGNTNLSIESTANSPSTSSRVLTPSSSVVFTRPGTPPQASAASINGATPNNAMEKETSLSALPISPSKPLPLNVWTARKEQMAQRMAAAAANTTAAASTQQNLQARSVEDSSNSKAQDSGNKLSLDASKAKPAKVVASKSQDDPFVVRTHGRSHPPVPSAPKLPSLDDADIWPEVGKAVIASTGASSSSELEKKESVVPSINHKKGEKTKWIQIPPSELQAASDASQSSSRAHSQNRRHQKSHSRQQSQTRNTAKPVTQQQSNRQNVSRDFTRDSRVGSAEVSAAHSRATSHHSSPMLGARGRRLPEDHVKNDAVNNLGMESSDRSTNAVAGPSSIGSNIDRNQTQVLDIDKSRAGSHGPRSGAQSMTHSQPHTPFETLSPAYHVHPSAHEYRGGSPSQGLYSVYPFNGGYPVTVMPLPTQEVLEQPQNASMPHYTGFVPVHQHQHGFMPPYLYQTVPIAYLPPQMHGQGPNPAHFDPPPMSATATFDANSILNSYVPPSTDNTLAQPSAASDPNNRAVHTGSPPPSTLHAPLNLPPSSSRSRPAPPEESEALSGYRRITTVPVSPLLQPLGQQHSIINVGDCESSPVDQPEATQQASEDATRRRVQLEAMVFGSVRTDGMKSPSPINAPVSLPLQSSTSSSLGLNVGETQAARKGTYTAFSVGFQGAAPRTLRVKHKRTGKDADRKSGQFSTDKLPTTSSEGEQATAHSDSSEEGGTGSQKVASGEQTAFDETPRSADDSRDVVVNVIDLTDRESKWEFGTIFQAESSTASTESSSNQAVEDLVQDVHQALHMRDNHNYIHEPQPVLVQNYTSPPFHPHPMGYNVVAPVHLQIPPGMMHSHSSSPQNMHPLPQHIPTLAPLHISHPVMSPLTLSSPSPGVTGPPIMGDEWEVRDYGYGPPMPYGFDHGRDERYERERERYESDRSGREFVRERDHNVFAHNSGRGRRGMVANMFSGYGGAYEGRVNEGRGGYEGRGYYPGRRGRGGPAGFGRGYRGGRGGYARHQPMQHSVSAGPRYDERETQQHYHHHQHQQQPTLSEYAGSDPYYPPNDMVQYLPEAFVPPFVSQVPLQPSAPTQQPMVQSEPPVPMPVTTVSFPIDDKRLRLLGQLEYYFSLQNLAQDLFLRQQMDSRGWIPIQLIASFNRVRQQTQNSELVREVLNLSELVELQGGHVRLRNGQWRNFILPDAAPSVVKDSAYSVAIEPATHQATGPVADAGVEGDVDDEDEDDVVFVMHEAKQS